MSVDESKARVIAACRAAIGEAPAILIEAVIAGLRPSLRLVAVGDESRDDGALLGRSRIGGLPDLPADLAWPAFAGIGDAKSRYARQWARQVGHPMSFVAQVDLAEVAELDPDGRLGIRDVLPGRGFLYFFYTDAMEVFDLYPEHGAIAAARWADVERSALRYTLRPSDLEAGEVYTGYAVRPRLEWMMPPPYAIEGLDRERIDANLEVYGALIGRVAAAQGFERPYAPRHRLIGHPDLVQSLGLGADERLLVQLDSDAPWSGVGIPRTGMMWGDGGRLYFTIRGQDLDARRFHATTAFFECS